MIVFSDNVKRLEEKPPSITRWPRTFSGMWPEMEIKFTGFSSKHWGNVLPEKTGINAELTMALMSSCLELKFERTQFWPSFTFVMETCSFPLARR